MVCCLSGCLLSCAFAADEQVDMEDDEGGIGGAAGSHTGLPDDKMDVDGSDAGVCAAAGGRQNWLRSSVGAGILVFKWQHLASAAPMCRGNIDLGDGLHVPVVSPVCMAVFCCRHDPK